HTRGRSESRPAREQDCRSARWRSAAAALARTARGCNWPRRDAARPSWSDSACIPVRDLTRAPCATYLCLQTRVFYAVESLRAFSPGLLALDLARFVCPA